MTAQISLLDARARQISVFIARIDRSGRHLRCRKYFNRVTKQKRARFIQALGHISDMKVQYESSMVSDLLVKDENSGLLVKNENFVSQNVPDHAKRSATQVCRAGWLARIRLFFLSLLKLLK